MSSIGRTPASERSQYLTPASERSQYITPPMTPGVLSSEGHSQAAGDSNNSAVVGAHSSAPAPVSPAGTSSTHSTQVPEREGAEAQKANAALEHESEERDGDLEKSERATNRKQKNEEDGDQDDEDKQHQVGWDGPDDPANPQNWSLRKKWWLSSLAIFLTINCTFASAAPSAAVMQIVMQFGVSEVISTLALTSSFLIGYCIGPLFWSTFSELYGRKPIFIISMFSYTAFIIGPPLAKNWYTIFLTRLFSGLGASAPLTNAGGLIADVMNPVHRGFAMSAFSGSVFLGPSLAPVVGSFLAQTVGWEWIFWVLLIYSFLSWAFVSYFLEETFAPVLLKRKAVRLRKEGNTKAWAPHERQDFSFKGIAERTLFRPFHILALEPMLVLITIYISVVYGLLYGLFEGVPVVFATLRPTEFNLGQSALPFLAVLIGTTIGALWNVRLWWKYYDLQELWKGSPPPEERLSGCMWAAPFLVVGLFWFGWTGAYPSVHWIAPTLALIPIGISFTLIFISLLTYITDSYLAYSASALAANTIIRSAAASGFPLFTRIWWTSSWGPQWACTLLGCVALILAPSPFLFYIYGHKIRTLSKWAPAPDLEIRKQLEQEGYLPEDSMNKTLRDPSARSGLSEFRRRRNAGKDASQKA